MSTNKIIKKTVILELPETLESGSAKVLCDKPYRIERTEEFGEIIWWGWNTNWKFVGGNWYQLVDNDFVICETPEYEIIYQELIKKSDE